MIELIIKLIFKINKFLNKLTLGNFVGGLKNNNVRSIVESSFDTNLYQHIISINKVYSSQIVEYDFSSEFPVYFQREKAFDPKYIYHMQDVTVNSYNGLIWIDNKCFFQESIGSLNHLLSENVLKTYFKGEENIDNNDPLIVLPSIGYYHWLLEILPNFINCLKYKPSSKILVNKNAPDYVINALEYILKDKQNNIIWAENKNYKVKNLIFASKHAYSGFINPGDINLLKNYFKNIKGIEGEYNKIYISRKKSRRSFKNENKLEKNIKQLGFKVLYLSEIDFNKQIAIFNNTDFVVAPHGAGLANIIWGEKEINVLEMFTDALSFNDCFAKLAVNCGHNYNFIKCKFDNHNNIDINRVLNKVKKIDK